MYTEDHVMAEVGKLHYLYKLKKEIRYAQYRADDDLTESVAEHIYGMHILAQYFIPLENPKGDWDKAKILEMITLHDADELETGDIVSHRKTDKDRNVEIPAMRRVVQSMPLHMQEHITLLIEEYGNLNTAEARFVKALDKFEPAIHLCDKTGKKLLSNLKVTVSDFGKVKEGYFEQFSTIEAYYLIIHKKMERDGYFSE
jgi:5'-deoxynucleotidase YfbR-like HD superfamily hydrolase